MKNNIFDNAKFGDRFKTRDGRMAVYRVSSQTIGGEDAHFLIVDKSITECAFSDNGLNIGHNHDLDIVSRWEEQSDKCNYLTIYKDGEPQCTIFAPDNDFKSVKNTISHLIAQAIFAGENYQYSEK